MPMIRALTFNVKDTGDVEGALSVAMSIKDSVENRGIRVWDVRLTLSSGVSNKILDRLCSENIIFSAYQSRMYRVEVEELKNALRCSNSYASIIVTRRKDIRKAVNILREVAHDLGVEATTRLAFSVGAPIETPYYPLSVPLRSGVTVALRYVDLLASSPVSKWVDVVAEFLRKVEGVVREAAEEHGVSYLGIDASLSPWMEESVVPVVERVLKLPFPSTGSAWAIRHINEVIAAAVRKAGVRSVGFNELMLPVGEDSKLLELADKGKIRLRDLTYLAAYCVAGIDMIAVPDDPTLLASLMLDALAAHKVKGRVVGVRVLPDVGGTGFIETRMFGRIPVIR